MGQFSQGYWREGCHNNLFPGSEYYMAFGFFGQFLTPNTNNFGYFAKCQAVTLFYQDLKYCWFCDMKTEKFTVKILTCQ